jgi:hypothetical protein
VGVGTELSAAGPPLKERQLLSAIETPHMVSDRPFLEKTLDERPRRL